MACACSTSLWPIILRVDFYHLTRSPVDKALPVIADKVLATGKRLAVVSQEADLLDRLDVALWSFRPESFLPHGRGRRSAHFARAIG